MQNTSWVEERRCGKVRACLIGLALLLFGCRPADPIRIGFVGGTSGRVADAGISARDAVQQAVEECNRAGGISGRKIRLIVKDDEQRPEAAKRVARELIADKVSAIIGPITSDMAAVMVPIVNEAKVPLVSPTVANEELKGVDDYFFRMSSTTSQLASRSALHQLNAKGPRRMSAAYDLGNRLYTEKWVESFRTTFARGGGELATAIGFDSGNDASFLQIARELLAAQPDGVLIVANSMDSALLCLQIRKLNRDIWITLSDWGATERLLELGGKAVEGVTVVLPFAADSKAPRFQAFRKTYLERFHREPAHTGMFAYEAASVVLDALKQQKEGQNLKEVILATSRYEGLQDAFSFDDFGDVKRPQATICTVRNGKFVALE